MPETTTFHTLCKKSNPFTGMGFDRVLTEGRSTPQPVFNNLLKTTIMKKLNWSGINEGMDKIARIQSIMAGATMLYSGVKNIKESPKTSILKSILGGYLIYTALSGKKPVSRMMQRITAQA